MAEAEVEDLPQDGAGHAQEPAVSPNDRIGLPQHLAFVDLETTGANAAYHRITEVGIVRLLNDELVEEWSSLVNPECSIPEYIEAFTGISDEMVAGAPRFSEIAALVYEKLQGAVFAAHNARFDYSFLRSEFRRLGMRFSAEVLCTVKLSRRLFPEHARHNLDAVMQRHGLSCSARHRALGDARVLHDFWRKLRCDVPPPLLAAAATTVLAAPKLPAHLPPDLADDLPEGPGVYRFFGENDALLYVGRSNSLRTSVLERLTEEQNVPRERGESRAARLASQVRRVDWLQTAGELGACLRESAWIRTQKPLHNRHPRHNARSFTLKGAPIDSGQARGPSGNPVEPVVIDGVEAQELAHCFGVFHSERDARRALTDIARAHQLCLKVLRLEEGTGSCFAFQVGKCKGACVGKEPPMLHDMRLRLALSSLKLKSWPFPGRIALRERDPWGGGPDGELGGADLHVVDHWVYLGTARSEEDLAALAVKQASCGFDADVYKILVRYFSKHPKLDWHDLHHRKLHVSATQ
jgi:DNA polymerase-3 subunit epsilon